MKSHCVAVARAAVLCLMTAQALADGSKTIQIEVHGVPKFEVIYHRALTNSTGAVVAGLIGAGIQAGIESDKDSKKREALKPHVREDVWNDAFVNTLSESLRTKGFEPLWVEKRSDSKGVEADIYLSIFPATYGFRMVDTNTALVSAYVEFEAVYAEGDVKRLKKIAKEPFYLTNKKQVSYETTLEDTAALSADIESVLAQAARRLANKIIYNVK